MWPPLRGKCSATRYEVTRATRYEVIRAGVTRSKATRATRYEARVVSDDQNY